MKLNEEEIKLFKQCHLNCLPCMKQFDCPLKAKYMEELKRVSETKMNENKENET